MHARWMVRDRRCLLHQQRRRWDDGAEVLFEQRFGLQPNQTQRWFTYNWPSNYDVAWMVVPTDAQPGGAHVTCDVALERTANNTFTYWLTVQNLTSDSFDFEARYNFLN